MDTMFLIMFLNIVQEIVVFFDELVAGGFLVSFVFLSIFLIIIKIKKYFLNFSYYFFF